MKLLKTFLLFAVIGYLAALLISMGLKDIARMIHEYENGLRVEPQIVAVPKDKPSYEFLKKSTVYIFQTLGIEDGHEKGAIGTGVVVGKEEGWYYILTNRHVCDKEEEGTCYIVDDGEPETGKRHLLLYVTSSDTNHDLALWKIAQLELPGKQPVKGIGSVSIQDNVYSVGHYLGIPFIYTEGTMAGYDKNYESGILEPLFNMPCVFGCSGSGIFNANGELVTLIWAGNSVPTSFPLITSFDTAKVIGQNFEYFKKFLKGYTNEPSKN